MNNYNIHRFIIIITHIQLHKTSLDASESTHHDENDKESSIYNPFSINLKAELKEIQASILMAACCIKNKR